MQQILLTQKQATLTYIVCVSSEKFDSTVNATSEYPRLCWMKLAVKNTDVISLSGTVTA